MLGSLTVDAGLCVGGLLWCLSCKLKFNFSLGTFLYFNMFHPGCDSSMFSYIRICPQFVMFCLFLMNTIKFTKQQNHLVCTTEYERIKKKYKLAETCYTADLNRLLSYEAWWPRG